MKLTFLGTRGQIDARTRRHRMHTAAEVSYRGRRVMVDAGEDWLGRLDDVRPRALVLTHAHPDHAWGLKKGAPAPVWATAETWDAIGDYPIPDGRRHLVQPRTPFTPVEGITLEAFPVEHSIRSPAVGYRITAGRVTVFYVPDLVYIPERAEALGGCAAYIGDGATMKQSFVRKAGDHLVGHAPVFTQLGWCQEEGVPRAIITHCGSEIVEGDERTLLARLREWARERGDVEAEFAHDGMVVVLRG
ncbi:MAG: MBL fold metallo-hydrolase [Gemmatimonadota bacterium]|jgi:phosphoribosyl 1,2-cyclic phosphodiesterase